MAFLGDLLIRLRAETADFQSDMGKAAYMAEKSMRKIQSAAAALGATLSAGAFVAMVKNTIDANDRLNDLSKTTGVAVEQLSGLGLAAKKSGGDLESIAAAMSKLSQNIGKDGDKFAKLGVTAKDPLEALKQLADVFVSISDPQTRAAVAAEALGKSWAGAAPLLAEGGQKIGEMVEQGKKLSRVTKEAADRADEFNDKMAELSAATMGARNTLVSHMLPRLIEIGKEFTDAAAKGEIFLGTLRAILQLAGWTDPEEIARQKEIIALAKKREEINTDLEKHRGSPYLMAINPEGVDRYKAQLAAIDARAKAIIWNPEDRVKLTPPRPPKSGAIGGFLGGAGKVAKVDPAIELALHNEQEIMREAGAATQKYYETVGKAIEAQGEFLMQMETTSAIRVWSDLDTDLASASKQLDDYTNKARKTSEIGRELGMTFSSAFEDAILQGKRFQDVLKGIAQDILRIIARKMVTEPIAASISNAIGNLFPGKAAGGPVMGGHSYLVGESGPEIFTAGASGVITPNGALGGMVVNFAPVYNIDSRTDSATIARMLDMSSRQSEARLIEQLNRGQGGITQAVRRA